MTRYHFKSENLGMRLANRESQKFQDISKMKNILYSFTGKNIGNQLNKDGRCKLPAEKAMWLIVRVIAILCMVLIMVDVTLVYKNSPTVTIPETEMYPMQKIDYPAIAICNVNRISRRAATILAQELLEFESTTFNVNLTLKELTRMLNLMGQLYLFEIDETNSETTKTLHTILERGYNGYDVNRIMKRLAPKCRSILQKCSWEGKDQLCDDIFLLRKTQDGYCCTFNYARREEGFGSAQNDVLASQQIERTTNLGSEYGLSVLLNPQLDDYTYKILPIYGFKVSVYSPLNHPDVSSGGVREVLVSPRTEVYIDLDAVLFHTTKDVRKYDIQERDCLFQTEQSKIFHGYYSFNDCIVHCRTRDILHLCNCVPFFYPLAGDTGSARICNLKDLSCLKKYRERWRNVKPRVESSMIPFEDSEFDGLSGYLSCDCLPSCTDITYNVQTSSIPLSLSELSWGRSKYAIKNHSVIRIYFGKNTAIRLRQDVLFYWYELMSNYGGICSLFLGVSIINVIELIYKLIMRIWTSTATIQVAPQAKEHENVKNVTTIVVQSATISKDIQTFHWQEITGALRKEFNNSNLLLNTPPK